jgi:uncharacterized protein
MKAIFYLFTLSLTILKLFGSSYAEKPNAPWGSDSDLSKLKREEEASKRLHVGQKSCLAMIRFFQLHISPIDGPRSSFYPTSSQYTLEAIQKHGVFQGIAMGCDRLMRENGEMWVYKTTKDYGIERKVDPVR